MKVGILSDTHDNLDNIRKAVDIFRNENISLLVHAGDFVAPFTLAVYRQLDCKFIGIFGNNDGDILQLNRRSEGRIHTAPHQFTYAGKTFIATHYPDAVDAMASAPGVDVVIYGHTHYPEIKTVGETLLINPGECGGWSSGVPTVAVLDTDAMAARIIDID